MLKGIFKRDEEENPASSRERQIVIEGQAEEAEEAMSLLGEKDSDDLDETMEEISAAVKKAAKTTLHDIRMMEEGRCPSCGNKARQFLFTSVCASCGWFSFISPEEGKSIIHLKTGHDIECGTTFDTQGDYILGITDGVVRAKVSKDNVQHIEYVWSDEEIEKKRAARARVQAGICSWCEKNLEQTEEEVIVVYAAFGSYQDRFIFCSRRCGDAFQHQYPIRVHKNCYNRPCPDCDLCIKKYSGEDETLLSHVESEAG
jgi:hypothetical protein